MPPLEEELRRSGSSEERRLNVGTTSDFPPPTGREVILRTTVPRPAPYSKPLPQRMYSVLTKEDFRLAGAFSADTTFFWFNQPCYLVCPVGCYWFSFGEVHRVTGWWQGANTVVISDSVSRSWGQSWTGSWEGCVEQLWPEGLEWLHEEFVSDPWGGQFSNLLSVQREHGVFFCISLFNNGREWAVCKYFMLLYRS